MYKQQLPAKISQTAVPMAVFILIKPIEPRSNSHFGESPFALSLSWA
jgi:hypothetical protein